MKLLKLRIAIIVWLLIALSGIASAAYYWLNQQRFPYTHDAIIQGVRVPIMTLTDGRVAAVYVQNHSVVKQGDILVELEDTSSQITLRQAQANLANVQQQISQQLANVRSAEDEIEQRQQALSAISKQLFQLQEWSANRNAIADVKDALANAANDLELAYDGLDQAYGAYGKRGEAATKIQSAQTVLAQAELNLQENKIIAPVSGYVIDLSITQGTRIAINQKLLNIIENDDWWVAAYFKPKMLRHIKLKQVAEIKLENQPQETIYGIVYSINTNGSKPVVMIKVTDSHNLLSHIGSHATVSIDTSKIVDANEPLPGKEKIELSLE